MIIANACREFVLHFKQAIGFYPRSWTVVRPNGSRTTTWDVSGGKEFLLEAAMHEVDKWKTKGWELVEPQADPTWVIEQSSRCFPSFERNALLVGAEVLVSCQLETTWKGARFLMVRR